MEEVCLIIPQNVFTQIFIKSEKLFTYFRLNYMIIMLVKMLMSGGSRGREAAQKKQYRKITVIFIFTKRKSPQASMIDIIYIHMMKSEYKNRISLCHALYRLNNDVVVVLKAYPLYFRCVCCKYCDSTMKIFCLVLLYSTNQNRFERARGECFDGPITFFLVFVFVVVVCKHWKINLPEMPS